MSAGAADRFETRQAKRSPQARSKQYRTRRTVAVVLLIAALLAVLLLIVVIH
jgi:hypothetical protein